MAELRESFPSTENVSTGAGVPLGARIEGEASSAIQGAIGFAFKDSSGNVILPQLNSSGQIPVTMDSATTTPKHNRGTNAGSASYVTVATITLTASKVIEDICVLTSCFRDSVFQLIQSDNAVETVLADFRCGPGQFTHHANLCTVELTAGATGAQLLLVKAKNVNALSELTATVSCRELA
jgi:hypothetical protein